MKFIFGKFAQTFIIFLFLAGFALAQTESESGTERYEKGEYEKAIEFLLKRVEVNEKDGEAWRFLGRAYARTKNLKQARKAFNKAENFDDKDLNEIYDTPVRILSKRPPRYTEEARRAMTSGRIKVAVEFGADGKIKYIVPIRGLPNGLTESAVKAASEIKFEPAVRNGKTVAVIKFVEYSFDIF